MKQDFINELVFRLQPFVDQTRLDDLRMACEIAVAPYEITKTETSLTVYEGDPNLLMLQKFLMAKIAKGLSPRTTKYYKESISKTLLTIGKPYNEITADDIRLYLAKRVQLDGVSKVSVNNERRNLSSFFDWLQREEILLRNPMKKVDPIKETRTKKQAFSQMEIEKLRASCSTSLETALFEVLLSTWARVSEVAAIKITDIQESHIMVHGKGDKYRNCYLNARAQLAVDRYLAERADKNPYLFPMARYAGNINKMAKNPKWYADPKLVSETGHRSPSTIEGDVRRIGKRSGVVNAHPHRFRRTGATMALRAGMPLITVSKLLGHESVETTQIYLDISDRELEVAHEKYVI